MKKILEKAFFALPDHFVFKTNARLRRAINFWLLLIWIFPGALIWFELKNALWFVGFMSVYAIWSTHFGAFSAETPVEQELEEGIDDKQ